MLDEYKHWVGEEEGGAAVVRTSVSSKVTHIHLLSQLTQ